MKLKLETKEDVSILVITEEISLENIPVLKAGLKKLFDSGKTKVVIDLTAVTDAQIKGSETASHFATIPGWALDQSATLVIASANANLGQAPTQADAVMLMKSAQIKLIAQESSLKAKLSIVQKEKANLEQKLSGISAQAGDIKTLQKEKSDLKIRIQLAEKQLAYFLKDYKKPFSTDQTQSQIQTVMKLLNDALTQQGITLT